MLFIVQYVYVIYSTIFSPVHRMFEIQIQEIQYLLSCKIFHEINIYTVCNKIDAVVSKQLPGVYEKPFIKKWNNAVLYKLGIEKT